VQFYLRPMQRRSKAQITSSAYREPEPRLTHARKTSQQHNAKVQNKGPPKYILV